MIKKMQGQTRFGDIQSALSHFNYLSQAMIDTSSLIYLQEIDLLSLTGQWIKLWTIPGVIREFGDGAKESPVYLIDVKNTAGTPADTDQMLCLAADKLRLPIISEDRQILMRARNANLPYFNALMVLNFLLYKNALDLLEYQIVMDNLRGTARYSEEIYEFGGRVLAEILRIQPSVLDK